MKEREYGESTPEYETFVEKFKPKLTTDDCFTPEPVYEVVKNWACEKYQLSPDKIIRPFWPHGDYEHFEYPEGCVVLDNPPFSIFSKICQFYVSRGIKFFLFAPSLTVFNCPACVMEMNHIICGATITYENGAKVNTAFVTNLSTEVITESAPDLREKLELAQKTSKKLPKYAYPPHVLTAAEIQKFSNHGVYFEIRKNECAFIAALDEQRSVKKTIYGAGVLLSDVAAARVAAARAAATCEVTEWKLSAREREIVESLNVKGS